MDAMQRRTSTLAKLERMHKTLRHKEPDHLPVSDFFWGNVAYHRAMFVSPTCVD